jgi:hypothetical protein
MSAIGGPNIGKESLDKMIFSFTPEQNGLSQPNITTTVPSDLPKSSFNVVTSSLSPFYNPTSNPDYINDGWWSQASRNVDYAPNQEYGKYTSYLNGNIAFTDFRYFIPYPINPYFLSDGITISGFINIDRFPIISNNVKNKLGVVSVFYRKEEQYKTSNFLRVGVRRANESANFCFGFQASFFTNLRLSLCTDYLFEINKWYSYSVHFKYNLANESVDTYMTVNGEPILTHTHPSFGFFNRSFGGMYKGTQKDDHYPLNTGFLNRNQTLSTGTRNIYHSISIYNGFLTNQGVYIEEGIEDSDVLRNGDQVEVRFLTLHGKRGFRGLHDNIRLGQHFIVNTYNANEKNLYESYKSIYL